MSGTAALQVDEWLEVLELPVPSPKKGVYELDLRVKPNYS
jgi:hypothetical protein